MSGSDAISYHDIKFAVINVAAVSTDAVLVAAVTGKRIRVISYLIEMTAAGTALFESGTATALTGTLEFTADVPVSFAGGIYAPAFETATGASLTLTTTGAGAAAVGHLAYIEISRAG